MNTKPTRQSLMKKYFTPEVETLLADVRAPNGFTVFDAVRSGVENPDSSVGVYAGNEESYSLFAPLFNPVIAQYHKYDIAGLHKTDLNPKHLVADALDPEGKYIVSTRIRVGRNLKGYAFAPAISQQDRLEVESKIVEALKCLEGDLSGVYYPLATMDEETRLQLVSDHFLFKKGDRFLESAGANRNWPEARGIFHSADKRFLVWVNEEDQLRIISMQPGGGLQEVFTRLARAITSLEKKLTFASTEHLGYLSSCPTNLGTAMRASVHIKLPKLAENEDALKEVCAPLNLSVRGVDGEHSESKGGIYDISNKQRLGLSEVDAVNILAQGVRELIAREENA